MTEKYLRAAELATALNIKLPTVRSWTRRGMPHLSAGRLVRFQLAAVVAWLEAGGPNGKKDSERSNDDA